MIINGNSLEALRTIESESVNCCVTSPPYYGLRDYGHPDQIGLESTPQEYIVKLVEVFDQIYRILTPDGTLWLNIADSYAGVGYRGGGDPTIQNRNLGGSKYPKKTLPECCKPKDLIGIPWMLAFALRDSGWYLRQEIIWAKPNPMPESVTDRCTKSHESIFLLSKQPNYYYNAAAIAEPVAESTVQRLAQDINGQAGSTRIPGKTNGTMKAVAPRYGGKKYTENPDVFNRTKSGNAYEFRARRNKRDVWTVSTKPFKDAHFATFPPELIEPCILAGCPPNGTVIDPFAGSGTVGMVAAKYNRKFILVEVNEEYCQMIEKRINNVQITMEI